MLIDWFTVGAQALNFIILVWLLKRFLYEPILTAIDARETRIAATLVEADRRKAEAKNERDEFQEKNTKFGQERDALMAKAMQEVEAERERRLAEEHKAADARLTTLSAAARAEAATLADQLQRLAAVEVFDIARKALADLASVDLEERMAEVFIRRLRQLTPDAKASLGAVLNATNTSAVVRSRFNLGTEVQASIRNALNVTFAADISLSFATAPALCGIELTVTGQRLAWDIAQYLAVLQGKVETLLSVG